MLAAWTELLPLFVVRWLALRACERVSIDRELNPRLAALARRDVLFVLASASQPPKAAFVVPVQHKEGA